MAWLYSEYKYKLMDKIYFYQYNQKYIKMYNKYIWGHLGKVYKVIIYNAIFFINISGPLF